MVRILSSVARQRVTARVRLGLYRLWLYTINRGTFYLKS